MNCSTLISASDLSKALKDPDQAKNLLILDCSCSIADPEIGKKLYAEGHVPGAVFVDFDREVTGTTAKGTGRHPLPNKQEFLETIKSFGWTPEKQVVIYDQGKLGFATRLWYEMRWAGVKNVCVLDGGFMAWKNQGLPLSTERAERAEGVLPCGCPLEQPVEMKEIQDNLTSKEFLLVDGRPEPRFHGIGETIDHKPGHIPGSISRSGSENFQEDGTFKSPEKLREEFLAIMDGRPAEKIIQTCGSGVNATINLMAMEVAGLPGSRLYPGSWSQWIDTESNPTEL